MSEATNPIVASMERGAWYQRLAEENQSLREERDRLRAAREHLAKLCVCRCDVAWTGRGRHDPVECKAYLIEEFDYVAAQALETPHTQEQGR